MKPLWPRLGVPALIALVGVGGAFFLAKQDRAKQVTTGEATTGEATVPVLAPPQAGQEQAYPGRNNLPPGAVIRSLDRLNAAAVAVGCPTVVPGDPAGKLLDLAECLGDRAIANLPGGQTGDRAK